MSVFLYCLNFFFKYKLWWLKIKYGFPIPFCVPCDAIWGLGVETGILTYYTKYNRRRAGVRSKVLEPTNSAVCQYICTYKCRNPCKYIDLLLFLCLFFDLAHLAVYIHTGIPEIKAVRWIYTNKSGRERRKSRGCDTTNESCTYMGIINLSPLYMSNTKKNFKH